jgi:hypothetical protein
VAIVQDIFGKGAAKLIPLLKDLAEETEAHAKLTAAQAAQAEQAEKNINRLKMTFEDARRELVISLTPAVIDFTQQALAATKASGGFAAGLALMMRADTGNIAGRLREIDNELKGGGLLGTMQRFGGGPIAGLRESGLLSEREYLLSVQRQRALAGGTGDQFLDARDLALRQKYTLNYQSPSRKGEGAGPAIWTPQDEEMFQARKKGLGGERQDRGHLRQGRGAAGEGRADDVEAGLRRVGPRPGARHPAGRRPPQGPRGRREARLGGGARARHDLRLGLRGRRDQRQEVRRHPAGDRHGHRAHHPAQGRHRAGRSGAIGGAIKDWLPFAEGGIMTPMGAMPLRRYDGGGIADSPQLAMFGEGSMNEAYVPLPDGRRIPVQMSGQSGHTFIIDARGADRTGLARLQA